jgi:hypothetical protein
MVSKFAIVGCVPLEKKSRVFKTHSFCPDKTRLEVLIPEYKKYNLFFENGLAFASFLQRH